MTYNNDRDSFESPTAPGLSVPDSVLEFYPSLKMETRAKFLSLPYDAPDWAHVLNSNLGTVAEEIAVIRETHQRILDVVEEVRPEVSSVIDSLRKNPMFKMFLGGK